MTDSQKIEIEKMRREGLGYKKIAMSLGVSENTVKSYCRRLSDEKPQENSAEPVCLCCGKPLKMLEGRKKKKFCSDSCRMKWWNSHLDRVNRKANYTFTCPGCGKQFTVYGNANRKYCCHECYIEDRFGGIRR